MPLSSQKTTDIQQQFDPMRRRLQQQEAANLQQQNDALNRAQARAGGGPAGAFVKQQQLAADASARRLQEGNEGVDAQQTAALNQARDVQEQRDWQTGERVAAQGFAKGEREAGQLFTSGEREAAQKFAANESAMARALQEAGLTGIYNGRPTIQQQTLNDAREQQGLENKINTGTTVATLLGNLKTLGYSPDQVRSIISDLGLGALPGVNIGEIPGVTVAPAPVAPAPAPTLPRKTFRNPAMGRGR